ncbi:hypothetical protein IMCC1989_65 [gamma proteobacterium IMCC1989]|nr:hypothetical protein IMCC1989_65 [gamma proteobacterium IMCC1989]
MTISPTQDGPMINILEPVLWILNNDMVSVELIGCAPF